MTVFIGADHRGFEMKKTLLTWLSDQGHHIVDCGNVDYNPEDDFPDFAFAVAQQVAQDPDSRGIVICGSGVGVNMAANKIDNIRASTALNPEEVRHGREHDDMNILALSADYQTLDEAIEMIKVFLSAQFEAAERFIRRINKIHQYEKTN